MKISKYKIKTWQKETEGIRFFCFLYNMHEENQYFFSAHYNGCEEENPTKDKNNFTWEILAPYGIGVEINDGENRYLVEVKKSGPEIYVKGQSLWATTHLYEFYPEWLIKE